MAPHAAPRSSCPGRLALPYLAPTLPYLSPAPQGTSSDWKNLPDTAQFLSTQTDTTMFALINTSSTGNGQWLEEPSRHYPIFVHTDKHHHVCFMKYQLHRERAMTGRIFQALPTQTDTTMFALLDTSSTGNGQWLEESSRHCPHRQTPLLL
jgi:hypothetical protein